MSRTLPSNQTVSRYHSAVILLHWSMAVAIVMMLVTGVIMVYVELGKPWQFQLYQWHKSGGVLLMLALALRIALRVITETPLLPAHFSKIEQLSAKLGHLGLYVAMTTLVVSGWAMVSSSAYGLPTVVFGWFTWPHIPQLQANQIVEIVSKEIHFFGAIGLGLILVGHVGAVVKHRIADRENILKRMWWASEFSLRTMRRPSVLLLISLVISLVIGLAVLVVTLMVFTPLPSPVSVSVSDTDHATASTVVTATHSHDFTVDTARSRVTFSGTHMGSAFTGVFKEWQARLYFNPDALEQSYIHATFVTDSASTGDAMYDGTLPESDWFASEAYPQAVFASEMIAANRETTSQKNSYRVTGLLTLRDISKSITFDMHIRDIDSTSMQFSAAFTIDRLAYRIGVSSDPEADWVSRSIAVQLDIQADSN